VGDQNGLPLEQQRNRDFRSAVMAWAYLGLRFDPSTMLVHEVWRSQVLELHRASTLQGNGRQGWRTARNGGREGRRTIMMKTSRDRAIAGQRSPGNAQGRHQGWPDHQASAVGPK